MNILLWIIAITLIAAVGTSLFHLLSIVISHPWVEVAATFFLIVFFLGILSIIGYVAYQLIKLLLA